MSESKFRKNPKTGRLEKLINGKYVPQKEMGFWKDALKVIKGTRRNVDAVGRKDGETRTINGRKQRWNGKSGRWVNVSNQQPTKNKTTSGLSKSAQQNLKIKADIARDERKKYSGMTQKEINALKVKEGEGIASKRTMSTFREDPEENRRLQLQVKTGSNETYKRGSSSGDSSSKSKSKSKKEEIMIGGKKATRIQKRLLKGGWTVKELEAKQKKHKEWEKNRGK